MKSLSFIFFLLLSFIGSVWASEVTISDAWIRTAPPGAPMAGYFTLENQSEHSRKVIGATADDFAKTMLHRSYDEGGVMKMEHVMGVSISPSEKVSFEPGGYHIMLMRPKKSFQAGDHIAIALQFDNGETMQHMFMLKEAGQSPGSEHTSHQASSDETASPETMDHSNHGDAHSSHANHAKVKVSGHHAPTLELKAHQNSNGEWMLMLSTRHFTFSKANENGDHQMGEGHAHLYINGEKAPRIYADHVILPELATGQNEIMVGLYTNNHKAYWVDGKPIRETINITAD